MTRTQRIHQLQGRTLSVARAAHKLGAEHTMGSASWCAVWDRAHGIMERIIVQLRKVTCTEK